MESGLYRGIFYGLLFVAPFWVAVVMLATGLQRT
jgi:hypothetical protein